ncbi:MAG TPA: 50S ribosomal protein L1 [Armatimonadota bacterium]|nr:50S ribosomal protein L1 [Armatimonadota bacterium]HOS44156.1 50S ribosomal protein L1 [Armatimonadota bacterium]
MAKHGKRYDQAVKKVPVTAEEGIAPTAAFEAMKAAASAKFDETVEVAVRLGVDPRQSDQMVRGSVVLPHGTGKSPKVAVITRGDNAAAAQEAGADDVGAEELVARIDEGWRGFDILVATRDMMGIVGKLGRKLGPRMPNPKAGTVTDNVAQTVRDLKGGKAAFRVDKAGNIHVPIGKVSYSIEQLEENLGTLLGALLRAKPASSKGAYLKKITISSTMGPSVRLDVPAAQALAGKG